MSAPRRPVPSLDLVAPVLAGKIAAIARLLSRAELGADEVMAALEEIYRHTGNAHIVGITGVPGSGKSSLLAQLVTRLRAVGRRVGIIAVDPSSPFSGGSILGDRIRMNELSDDPAVFIRSMATRGSLGGLARATLDAADILDAAGYDPVVIETVGVGQDEVEIVQAAHSTVVVSAPGLGDDIQAVKAGVLEIADIHVVSKCDRADANRTITDLKNMLGMAINTGATNTGATAWQLPVVATSAHSGEGIDELVAQIDAHRVFLRETGELRERQVRIAHRRLLKAAQELLRDEFKRHQEEGERGMAQTIAAMIAREVHPQTAARELIGRTRKEIER
jgi:LAO/AO transport system kinase